MMDGATSLLERQGYMSPSIQRKLSRTFYLCILNMKGGIGKTTTATHLAYYFAKYLDLRVLLVDCDIQSNSSQALSKESFDYTLTHVLKGEVPLHQAIYQIRDNLFLLPSDWQLDEAVKHIVSSGVGGYTLLQRSLKLLEQGKQLPIFEKRGTVLSEEDALPLDQGVFDVVIFDNAGLTTVTEAALYASDAILGPVQMQYFSYAGISHMVGKLEEIMNTFGRDLEILGIIPYAIDERFNMTKTYSVSLKKAYEIEITVPVRTDASIQYAQPKAKTVFETEPKSRATQDFTALGDQIFQRIQESLNGAQ